VRRRAVVHGLRPCRPSHRVRPVARAPGCMHVIGDGAAVRSDLEYAREGPTQFVRRHQGGGGGHHRATGSGGKAQARPDGPAGRCDSTSAWSAGAPRREGTPGRTVVHRAASPRSVRASNVCPRWAGAPPTASGVVRRPGWRGHLSSLCHEMPWRPLRRPRWRRRQRRREGAPRLAARSRGRSNTSWGPPEPGGVPASLTA
jgi:hypothetical protein